MVMIWELFDLICGTSTGGIIAMAIGILRMPLAQIKTMYYELAGEVFGYHFGDITGYPNSVSIVTCRTYVVKISGKDPKTKRLESLLKKYFGENKIYNSDESHSPKVKITLSLLRIRFLLFLPIRNKEEIKNIYLQLTKALFTIR